MLKYAVFENLTCPSCIFLYRFLRLRCPRLQESNQRWVSLLRNLGGSPQGQLKALELIDSQEVLEQNLGLEGWDGSSDCRIVGDCV